MILLPAALCSPERAATRTPPPPPQPTTATTTTHHQEAAADAKRKAEEEAAAAAAAAAAPPAPPVLLAEKTWVTETMAMILGTVLNPASNSRLRASAARCLDLLASALGLPTAEALRPLFAELPQQVMSRRLLPVKSAEWVLGQVV
jgi:hypothetical protein